ncbi:hypothetical protein SLA2020_267720 [Shorea laevis]
MARFLPYICFVVLILLTCMEAQAGRLGPTPDDEGEAVFVLLPIYTCWKPLVKLIAVHLRKKDWKLDTDPCINDTSWLTPATPKSEERLIYNSSVFCNCSYPGGVCHVESM